MLPPSKINGTTLDKALVAEGCIINALRIESSVIGIRSRIKSGTTISNTYIMGNDSYETLDDISRAQLSHIPLMGVGSNCLINTAIIDKDCRIGNDVKINGGPHLENTDHPLYTVKDGVVVVKKGSIIPDGFSI